MSFWAIKKRAMLRHLSQHRSVESARIELASCAESSLDRDCGCDKCDHPRAARALHSGGPNCHFLASLDPDLQRVIEAWDSLPEAIRRATLALIDWGSIEIS
jgi:hypothetical protein